MNLESAVAISGISISSPLGLVGISVFSALAFAATNRALAAIQAAALQTLNGSSRCPSSSRGPAGSCWAVAAMSSGRELSAIHCRRGRGGGRW